jgi:transglutaminase-like putative cysteine protease
MMAPRGLVGLCAAAWGVALGYPILGVILGVFLEGFRFTRVRAPLADRTVARVLRVTFLLAIIAFVALIATQRAPHSLYMWLRALPILLLPLPVLQILCGGELGYAALLQALRFGDPGSDPGVRPRGQTPQRWDATHGYALCCLVAAGTMAAAEPWYFAVALMLIAWAILANVPGRRIKGMALVACAGAIGFGVETGLYRLQAQLEEWGEEFFEDLFTPDPDPFRERTRIGDMGRIKLNDRIVMRAIPEGPRPMQILLRESAFDSYRNGVWEVSHRLVRPVERDGDAWRLLPDEGGARVIVRRSFPRGEGLLPLPMGTSSIRDLEAATMETTDTRAVRVKGLGGPIAMRVSYDEDRETRVPAASDPDREVPEGLRPMLEGIVVSEGLRSASAKDAVKALERYFGAGFSYSLQLSQRDGTGGRSIADFLLRDHKGHCEYFATATVLLLRQAGIPARYAVGYSAQEFSTLERAFVVRNRHAHAWAMALVDGRWTTVDTTPANWAEKEAEAARSPFGAVIDVLSWIWESAQRAWVASDATLVAAGIATLVLLLALPWIARRLPRFRRGPKAAPPDRIAVAWSEIEARAGALGFARDPRETVRAWLARLSTVPAAHAWHASLCELATLYYRARFDPAAPADTPARLAALAKGWGLTPGSDPGVRPR